MNDSTPPTQINSLTSLRFLCAIAVFWHHLDVFNDLNIPGFEKVMKFLFEGYIGVNFFFVLSGFIIAHVYRKRFIESTVDAPAFMFYRISRLWPVHLLTLLMAVFVYKIHPSFNLTTLTHLFMFQSMIPADPAFSFGFNGVSWSISTEMFFYFSFTFLVLLPSKKLFQIFLATIFIIILMILTQGWNLPASNWFLYISPLRIVDFIGGMLLNIWLSERRYDFSHKTCTLLELGSIFCFTLFVAISLKLNVSMLWKYDLYYLFPTIFMIFAFSFDRGFISYLMNNRVLIFLGDASFAFYMCHQIILVWVKINFYGKINSIQSVFIYSFLALAITIVVSGLVHSLFEKPIYKYLRKKYNSYWLKSPKNEARVPNA